MMAIASDASVKFPDFSVLRTVAKNQLIHLLESVRVAPRSVAI